MISLPTDAKARKDIPLATGCLDYFPDAISAVAALSKIGNEQHNPGKPLHWDRSKSVDEADALMRHFLQRGTIDTDGVRHSAKIAWRALALLQKEIEDSVLGAAGDSWIMWFGGDCPVAADDRVHAVLLNGDELHVSARSLEWNWREDEWHAYDIRKYRTI
jgi:hypothetical protein